MKLFDGTEIPPMTRAQAEAKIVERFKTRQQYGLYTNAIAHKTAGGTCCLIVYHYDIDGWKPRWEPILLMSDSCWEGAWYRYDREEAYKEYAARDSTWAQHEALCLKLLNPQPEPGFWDEWKRWLKLLNQRLRRWFK